MKKNIHCFLITMGCLALVLNACQSNIGIENIKVDMESSPVESISEVEKFPLSNCIGNIELKQTLGSENIIQRKVIVDRTATDRNGFDYEIPESDKLQLEIGIEDAYQLVYETKTLELRTVTMNVVPGKQAVYTIHWKKLTYSSKVYFARKGEIYRAPYTYELIIPKLFYREEIDCSIKEVQLTPSISTPTFSTPAEKPTIILTKSIFLYAGPSTIYGGVNARLLAEGEKVYVVAKIPNEQWFMVETLDGISGWLFVEWVEITIPLLSIPIVTPVAIPATTRLPKSYP